MVNLSLAHRVKLQRGASLYSESANEGTKKTLLGVSAALAVCNVLFFIAGAMMTGIIDHSWYTAPESTQSNDSGIHANRLYAYCPSRYDFLTG